MRFENKVMVEYFKHAAREVLKGNNPNIVRGVWERLKSLPENRLRSITKGDIRAISQECKEEFIRWRWRRSELLYKRGPEIKINPLIRDMWFSIRSAIEDWYVLQGYELPRRSYDIQIVGEDYRVHSAILTPRMELVFLDGRPEKVPRQYFSIYQMDETGERAFPIYHGRIISGLVPLLSGGNVNNTIVGYRT